MGGVPAPRPGFRTQMHRLRLPEPPRSGPQTRRPYTGCHRLYITTRLRRLCTQVIEIGNHERARPPAVDEATAWRQATWQTSYRSGASAAPRTVAPRPTNTCVRGFCNLARMQSMDIWRWRVSQWTSGGGAAAICTCQVNMQCTLFINFADCACTSCVDVPTVTRPAAQDAAI
jgi:hypothetical protein